MRIPERTLRRYAERFDRPKVELIGRRVVIAAAAGGLVLTAEGERHFGGEVVFELAPDAPERPLVEAIAALHACARPPAECDCCSRCGGEGTLASGDGRVPCWTCAGMGYVPTELR